MPLNVALLGYGSIAHAHARAVQTLRQQPEGADLRLYGVMGRVAESAQEFAREYGMGVATTDLDAILADDQVGAVIITSPTELHADQTERALRAGKDVLCEIPLATSLADTDRLIRVADETGQRLMVAHTERFYPPLQAARRMVEAGELHIHSILSRFMFHRRENVNWMGRRRSWTDNLLWHHACHSVDSALWLMGAQAAEVTAQIALPGGNLDIPMDLAVLLRTPRDQIASIFLSYNTMLPLHDYLIIGQETTVHYTGGELRGPDGVLVPAHGKPEVDEGVVHQNAEFFAALREGREPSVTARAVRPAMAALQAAQDSLDARISAHPGARHPDLP